MLPSVRYDTQTQENKEETGKWDFIKVKNFSALKDSVKKVKQRPTEWRKMFANNLFDKGSTPKIYKELL